MTPFQKSVYQTVKSIPRGSAMTYAEVAKKAGYPGAARAVGSLMARNFDPSIPCHRVIRSDGSIGQYNRGGETMKRHLLSSEQAKIRFNENRKHKNTTEFIPLDKE